MSIDIILILIISIIGITTVFILGLMNLRYLFYMWVVSLPFATKSLYDLGFMSLQLGRIILFFLLLFFMVYFLLGKITFSKISTVELFMLLFTLICLVSTIRSDALDRLGLGTLLSAYIFPFFGYYLVKSFINNVEDVKSFAFAMALFSVYLAYVAIFEQIDPTLVVPQYITNPDELIAGAGRSVGPSLEPTGYGVGLLLCYLFAIYLFFRINDPMNLKKMVALLSILLTPMAVFFTYTRAIWGGFICSIAVLSLFYPRGRGKFLVLLLTLVLSFITIQSIDISKTEGSAYDVIHRDTIYFRLSMAKTGIIMFFEKPIFGFGQFQFRKEFPPYFQKIGTSTVPTEGFVMHNTYLNILVELGLIGFVPFVVIWIYLIKDAMFLYKISPENRDIAIIFLAGTVVFISAAMTNDMVYRFANTLFFIIAGMIKALLNVTNSKISSANSPNPE